MNVFFEYIFQVNKLIQKRYHGLFKHRQSIEYHAIAQNKAKLYLNSDKYMNFKKNNKQNRSNQNINHEPNYDVANEFDNNALQQNHSSSSRKNLICNFIKQKKYKKYVVILFLLILTIITSIITSLFLFQPKPLNHNGKNQTNETESMTTTTTTSTITTEIPLNTTDYEYVFGKLIKVDEETRSISFDENAELDLKFLFEAINWKYKNKHFLKLTIQNDLIESIDENILGEISFDRIEITECSYLKQIHWHAFGKQSQNVKNLNISLLLFNLTSKPNTEYDLYRLINSLDGCEVIVMDPIDNVLQPINLKKLKILSFSFYFASIKIESIKDFAFYECDSIQYIGLASNSINNISEHAFHLKNQNDQILTIDLSDNDLTSSSFALNSFNNAKRPTKLDLTENKIEYLDKRVFKPFLDAYQNNQIMIDFDSFKVNHDKNQWNQIDEDYKNRIIIDE